ncbi:MAG: hypothetical protein IT348_17955 [Candidatus Eisenbacteria bacterium]|nr:hypothetical protein [Candidatus Eisenbacteria bacterium]
MRVAVMLAVLLGACFVAGASAAEPEITRLAWLSGCWASDGGEPGSGEQWSAIAGETMLGMGRTVRRGKTVNSEFMELRHLPDGRLAFIAHPSGQPTAAFPVLTLTDTSVVFENLQHDFPQRVAYVRAGDSKVRARIEGMRNGKLRVIEFPMTRVPCDHPPTGAAE